MASPRFDPRFRQRIAPRLGPLLVALVIGGLAQALVPGALAQDSFHLRGALEAVEPDSVTVRTEAGEVMAIEMAEDTGVFIATPASLDDVEPGAFVGITSIETDQQRIALEAHIFSEDLRGIGEGHYAWDLVGEPNMMTNATVAEVKAVGADRELVMTYQEADGDGEGEQVILVPEGVPIVAMAKGEPAALEVGKTVFLVARNAEDGTPTAVAAVIGNEGAEPPM